MKNRLLYAILTLVLAVSLIAGGTMAWFTAQDNATPATFTAGTVRLSAGETVILGKTSYTNVNPGDCFLVTTQFENTGSKAIELRTTAVASWSGVDMGKYTSERTDISLTWSDFFGLENVYVVPHPSSSDWVLYQEAGGPVYAYYTAGPIASGEKVDLRLVVYFDGPLTGNAYQAATLTLGGTAEAVQASNNAPFEVWGPVWNTVNTTDYSFDYALWHPQWASFSPITIKCYNAQIMTFDQGTLPGAWYRDRFTPAGFRIEFFDGNARLKHSINASDVPSDPFRQYQGMKLNTPAGTTLLSVDLYIPSDWANRMDVRAGMWATANNGNLSYPIIEFTNNVDPADPVPVPQPRFRVWQSGTGWVDIGLPTGFTYDQWHKMTIKLDVHGGIVTYSVGDLTHVLDSQHATGIINVILQGHNLMPSGATYDIYWDNLIIGQ